MLKSAIFDMDGTLLDSMSVWDDMGERYLRSIGIEPHDDVNSRLLSLNTIQVAEMFRKDYGVALSVEEIIDGVNRLTEDYYRHEAEPKPHVREFLEMLKREGAPMCVMTSTDRCLTEMVLERVGLLPYFSNVYITSESGSKADPEIYRDALASLGTRPEDTYMFDDLLYALKGARAMGLVTVGVQDRYARDHEEIRATADYYLTDFSDTERFRRFAGL